MSNKSEETGIQGKQINENDTYSHIWNILSELIDTIDTTAVIFS